MATDEDIKALSMLGGYLIFSILQRRPSSKILTLIDAGAPLWYQDGEGTSPLHAAAYIEDEELVRVLIEKGALWNAGEVKRRGVPQIALIFSVPYSGQSAQHCCRYCVVDEQRRLLPNDT
jgi:protein arginine N-methyltransferase 2